MAEKSLASYVKNGLKSAGYRTRRIESFGLGIADVYFQKIDVLKVRGWIELKCTGKWPVRANTTVKLSWLTPEQVLFCEQYYGWLLVRVDSTREYFLWDWLAIRRVKEGLTQEEWRQYCMGYWKRSINWSEMDEKLSDAW